MTRTRSKDITGATIRRIARALVADYEDDRGPFQYEARQNGVTFAFADIVDYSLDLFPEDDPDQAEVEKVAARVDYVLGVL